MTATLAPVGTTETRTRVHWTGVVVFVGLAVGLAWLVTLPLWLGRGLEDPFFQLYALGMMSCPAVAALVATFLVVRPAHRARFLGLVPIRPVKRLLLWCLVGLLGPTLLAVLALLLGAAVGIAPLDLSFSNYADLIRSTGQPAPDAATLEVIGWVGLLTIPLASLVSSVAAFGEELGWRGFLMSALQPLGVWPSLLLNGVVWGVWHAPLLLLGYKYGLTNALGVVLMTVSTVLIGVLFGWLRMRSASVYPAALAHGALNATTSTLLVTLVAVGEVGVAASLIGWTGWVVLAVAIALVAWRRGFRWATDAPPGAVPGAMPDATPPTRAVPSS